MSFYGFRAFKEIDRRQQDIAVLYKFPNGGHDRHLDETIDELTKRRIPPDRVLIVCPKGSEVPVAAEFAAMSDETKHRLRAVSHVVLAFFDHTGKVEPKNLKQLYAPDGEWQLSDDDVGHFVDQGMEEIIRKTGTRMTAPVGYVFRKPSEKSNRVFIRTGNMLKNPSALAVIFHAMTRTLPVGFKKMYIDSFTILSIALTYQKCMADLTSACGIPYQEPTITNFHSYEMDDNLTFEASDDYIILISASSSGGLAAKLVTERFARGANIFHLLMFSDKTSLRERVVYFRNEPSDKIPALDGVQKTITIPGEEFMASHGETRTVDIKLDHLVSSERKLYKDDFYQEALVLNLIAQGEYGASYRPIGFVSDARLGSSIFTQWLDHHAFVEVPASTNIIIAVDSGRSKQLADYLAKRIPRATKKHLDVMTLDDLLQDGDSKKISESGSVLVVCADESDGESLLAVSQSLRSKPHLHRHYLIGHLFPSSAKQYIRLKSNLCINGKAKKYGWSVYCVTPVGDELTFRSWLDEIKFGYSSSRFQRNRTHLSHALRARSVMLKGNFLKGTQLFLPKVTGAPLVLRPGSVFFEKEYGKISHVNVLVQVAAALQRARDQTLFDEKILADEICFQNNPFIDSVIDPDTFSRFNDGAIQAAILRASCASELNYSRDYRLSRYMMSIFLAVVRSRESNIGEAVLEFMLAISTAKLRFHEEHFSLVKDAILKEHDLKAVWNCFGANSPL